MKAPGDKASRQSDVVQSVAALCRVYELDPPDLAQGAAHVVRIMITRLMLDMMHCDGPMMADCLRDASDQYDTDTLPKEETE